VLVTIPVPIAVALTVSAQMGKDNAQVRMGRSCARDCEAIGLRLRAMIANSELTPDQARERHNAACGRRGQERSEQSASRRGRNCEGVGLRRRDMVEKEELPIEEIRERYSAACRARVR